MKRMLALLTALLLLFSGCQSTSREIVNSSNAAVDFADYAVLDIGASAPVMYNKKTGEVEVFFSDPLTELDEDMTFSVFAGDGENRVAMCEGRRAVIYRVDLDTLRWAQDRGIVRSGTYESYLGAERFFPFLMRVSEAPQGVYALFRCSDGYVTLYHNGVYRLRGDRPTKEECLYEDEDVRQDNAAFDGRTVYYLKGNGDVAAVDVYTGAHRVAAQNASGMFLTPQGLLTVEDGGGGTLYLYPPDRERRKLTGDVARICGCSDRYIYLTRDYQTLERMDFDGGGRTGMPFSAFAGVLGVMRDPDLLYVVTYEGDFLCDWDGGNVNPISRPVTPDELRQPSPGRR